MAIFTYPETYDIVVIGAGHAGCEAANICSKFSLKTLLITQNLDTIAQMSCNPSIGGVGKGQIVREIDALGGLMGIIADKSAVNYHVLNTSRGPAVRSPRAQCDKKIYHIQMKLALEKNSFIRLLQDEVYSLYSEGTCIKGVLTARNTLYLSKAVIVATGTFMKGAVHVGLNSFEGGRYNDPPSNKISDSLSALGLNLSRLKTGTPMRLNASGIDFSLTEEQKSDSPAEPFSIFSDEEKINQRKFLSCWVTRTSEDTAKIIKENLHTGALYGGKIKSLGPRYCPSIEDKIVKFPHHGTHHLFLEPEGYDTKEYYINGLSTSLSEETQIKIIKSVPALAKADFLRAGYAIEYDYSNPMDLKFTLESKIAENLYLAGQINGTTGYEEAAAQGLMAGINAALKIKGKEPLAISREQGYIGVMIDDLINKGIDEPYRMFTSRAEFRLMLRQENADLRLSKIAFKLGLLDENLKNSFLSYEQIYFNALEGKIETSEIQGPWRAKKALIAAENEKLYSSYIERNKKEIEKNTLLENVKIPGSLNYSLIKELSNEAKQKLGKIKPNNLLAASRITGLTPSDIQFLWILIKKETGDKNE